MKYTVVWKTQAKRDLADLWMNATDRAAVARAADEMEADLHDSPLLVGESREANRRILIHAPLVMAYRVIEADRLVRVISIRVM